MTNRASMGENLIPRRQLRSKRDQYRRKLAIYTKIYCFWYLLRKRALSKQNVASCAQTAQIWGKISSPTPPQEQTRPISTETSNLYKKYTVSDISCVNGHCRTKRCKLMTKPPQTWGKISSRDANSGANETMTTETSNLDKKYIVSDISLQKRALKNKSCKLMTKPRRYGGKSHPATPTQEQTRPMTTEASNLYKKYIVSDISYKNEPWKNKSCKLMTKPRRYGGKSHPATPTQEQTRPISTETSNLYENILFLISAA